MSIWILWTLMFSFWISSSRNCSKTNLPQHLIIESQSLLDIFGGALNNGTSWNISCDACEWSPFVTCLPHPTTDNQITELFLDIDFDKPISHDFLFPEKIKKITITHSQNFEFPFHQLGKLIRFCERFKFVGDCFVGNEIETLEIRNTEYTGPVSLMNFENMLQLKALDLSHNKFTGTVSLPSISLWKTSHHLEVDLSNNLLMGKLILSHLGNGLTALNLNSNRFTGEITFDKIHPTPVHHLDLSNNSLHGSLDFRSVLRSNITTLSETTFHKVILSNNKFSGDIWFGDFVPEYFDVSHNSLNGTIYHHNVIDDTDAKILFDISGNNFKLNCQVFLNLTVVNWKFGYAIPNRNSREVVELSFYCK